MTESVREKGVGGKPETPGAQGALSSGQRFAILVLDAALVGLSVWVLRGFLSALSWAVVLTIATWPLYARFLTLFNPRRRRVLAPILFSLLITLVFLAPLSMAVFETWREMNSVVHWLTHAERMGVEVPSILYRLPYFSAQITNWWMDNLAAPGAVSDLLGRADTGKFAMISQEVGITIARRVTLFAFTVLTLFFLFRDGVTLARRVKILGNRILGPRAEYIVDLTASAVRSTADGLVLVGLGEGAILGVAYAVLGVPHPALLGAFTAIFAIIPFGAPVLFCLAAAFLFVSGALPEAIGLLGVGFLVIGVADHFIRPALIGGQAKLPFLWVLLGIFGGLESFGLIGLFLGPAIMAALVSLWRDWTAAGPIIGLSPPGAEGLQSASSADANSLV
jgi:predicted PurR-regulated permease PerM